MTVAVTGSVVGCGRAHDGRPPARPWWSDSTAAPGSCQAEPMHSHPGRQSAGPMCSQTPFGMVLFCRLALPAENSVLERFAAAGDHDADFDGVRSARAVQPKCVARTPTPRTCQ